MENYIGIVIAVENYHDKKNLKKVQFALSDAQAIFDSLIELGCDKDKIELIADNIATKTTIDEKIKKIAKYATKDEVIILYYAGHGFFYNGKNLISCVDTSLNALEETTLNLHSILALLDKSKSNRVIAFLDCCHSGIEFTEVERSPVSDFSTDELKYEYRNAEHLTVFASCKSNEKSQADSERKHGVWSYFLIQALRGKEQNIYDHSLLFSDKLQKYLHSNTYERVKLITIDKKNQTPVKYGKETVEKFIVADLSKIFEEEVIKANSETIKFEKATILVSEEDWVKNLPGFDKAKNHKPPKSSDDYHERWIKKIASDLIKDELNEIAELLKQKLKYKRKDIQEPLIDEGTGQLSTLDFDYIVAVTQSSNYPEKYILTRSIENFKNSNILSNPEFNDIFQDSFDILELYPDKAIKVEEIIDKITSVRWCKMD